MNAENIYRLTAMIIILSAVVISITFRHRARIEGRKSGDQISAKQEEQPVVFYLRSIFGTALWLSSLVYLINPKWMAWSSLPLPAWARWTGAAIGLIGIPMIYWVFSSLGNNVTHTTATRKQSELVTQGPYRWVRHPLYTVGMINFIGFSLLSANWFIMLTAAIAFTTILMRTPMEEKRLIERFGEEYRQYMNTTGRYLPKVTSSR
jgi:protein-S-isoprenylcysteine O-methyltransferase Ste14